MTDEQFIDEIQARVVAAALRNDEKIPASPDERKRLYTLYGYPNDYVSSGVNDVYLAVVVAALKKVGRLT